MKKRSVKRKSKKIDIDAKKIQRNIKKKQGNNKIKYHSMPIEKAKTQRKSAKKTVKKMKKKKAANGWIKTHVPGFDELLDKGIPKGLSLLVAGGPGTGKTIFCLQMAAESAKKGEKVLYLTFEEPEVRLIKHMEDFGYKPKDLIKSGKLKIMRINPFDITRTVEAMMEESKGELLIKANPLVIPAGFKPDRIVVDSLSAIASAFVGKEESYRIYIEHLFRFFEKSKATSFLITEIVELAKTLTEEFLADGVIVLYNVKHGNVRERAIEILKLRGAKHSERIVALQISEKGLVVYPEQEVFGEI